MVAFVHNDHSVHSGICWIVQIDHLLVKESALTSRLEPAAYTSELFWRWRQILNLILLFFFLDLVLLDSIKLNIDFWLGRLGLSLWFRFYFCNWLYLYLFQLLLLSCCVHTLLNLLRHLLLILLDLRILVE